MLKLYFSPLTSSLATHIALIECGAPFELDLRDMNKQATRAPEYLAINAAGKVPRRS
jgi:glutathione S-transferase